MEEGRSALGEQWTVFEQPLGFAGRNGGGPIGPRRGADSSPWRSCTIMPQWRRADRPSESAEYARAKAAAEAAAMEEGRSALGEQREYGIDLAAIVAAMEEGRSALGEQGGAHRGWGHGTAAMEEGRSALGEDRAALRGDDKPLAAMEEGRSALGE